jgi:hypothetical protein
MSLDSDMQQNIQMELNFSVPPMGEAREAGREGTESLPTIHMHPNAQLERTTIEELASYMRGWRSYFGFCETPEVLLALTRWVRLRIRAAMWRQWETPRRRREALLELGVRPRLASNTAGSGLGPWYLAKAKALSVGLSNAYLKSLGLPSLVDD